MSTESFAENDKLYIQNQTLIRIDTDIMDGFASAEKHHLEKWLRYGMSTWELLRMSASTTFMVWESTPPS